jgi:acetyltransferase-like isoleucine patch superfamily enzyme
MRGALLTHASLPPRCEKDRIISGETCLPNTMQLVEKRKNTSGPLDHFNSDSDPSKSNRPFERFVAPEWSCRRAGDRPVSGRLGSDVLMTAPCNRDYGYNIIIGDNVVIGPDCQMLGSGRVAIGSNTKVGARVTISTLEGSAVTRSPKQSTGGETSRGVDIGDNVYICDGCIIEAGICIGNNAIVRAGSVVTEVSSGLARCRNRSRQSINHSESQCVN